jgi:hypothetical protein
MRARLMRSHLWSTSLLVGLCLMTLACAASTPATTVGRALASSPSPAASPLPTTTTTTTTTATTTTNAVPTATARPTAVPTAAATATPTARPVTTFYVDPLSASHTNCATNPIVPAAVLRLDNTNSTVAVSWRATAVETIQALNAPWATISPASGVVPAGAKLLISVTPTPANNPVEVCQLSNPPPGTAWHVKIVTTNAGTFTFVYTVSQ